MHKIAALALAAVVGVAAIGFAKPAEARVYVGVGIGLPGVVVAPPVVAYPGVYAPYYGYYPYYYGPRVGFGPGFVRYGYAHGYGYRGGYVRHWR